MGRSTRSIALALALAGLGACGGSAPPRADEPVRPTRLVMLTGERAHAVGTELARDTDGRVLVALHEGRSVWVEPDRVEAAELAAGDRVAVRWDQTQALFEAVVVERADDLLRVRFVSDSSVSTVPLSAVIAVLDATLEDEGSQDDGQETEDDLPEVDPARQVLYRTLDGLTPGRAVRCDAGGMTVLMTDGTARTVSAEELAATPLSAGDRVAARYQGGALSYLARVEDVRNGRVSVRYEDDGSEEELDSAFITLVMRPHEEGGVAPSLTALCRQLRGASVPTVLVKTQRIALAGRLEECAGDRAQVLDRVATRQEVPVGDLVRLAPATGDELLVPWGESHFLARVANIDGTRLTVRYEDGSESEVSLGAVEMAVLPLQAGPPPEPVTCP